MSMIEDKNINADKRIKIPDIPVLNIYSNNNCS
jgi:hypothetical protein